MKTIQHHATARDKLLHVETEGCVVNISVGLHDREGREVTSVEIVPDRYVGGEWTLDGYHNSRVIKGVHPEFDRHREVIRQAALAFLHGDDDQGISLKDLADALDVAYEDVEAIQAQDAETTTCRHCGRRIVHDKNEGWIDPEAGYDDEDGDGIWRTTCDSHDTFTAEHEPEETPEFTWLVTYQIRSGIDGGLVSESSVMVTGDDEAIARERALAWVHSNDPHDDDRIDPIVKIIDVEEAPSE